MTRHVPEHPGALDAHPLLSSRRRRQTRNAQLVAGFRARTPTLRYLGWRQNSDGCRHLAVTDGRSARKYPMDRATGSWLQNRDTIQPGDAFFERTVGGMAHQLRGRGRSHLGRGSLRAAWNEQVRCYASIGLYGRRHIAAPRSRFAKWRPLSTIKDVVRKGRVRRIERDAIVLEKGKVDAAPGDLYVDCTAKAFSRRLQVPVFDGDQHHASRVRPGRLSFSAAFIAHVEAIYDDDAIKNDLCEPISSPDVAADWLRNMLSDLRNGRRWSAEKALGRWIAEHRLSGAGFPDTGAASTPEGIRILERLRKARPRAAANLARLIAELESPHLGSG